MKYIEEIIRQAKPLKNVESLSPLIDSLKDKKIVMIGEASHGTKEFYEWRESITQELIMNHGFDFIAVEGDWPPSQKINEYVRGELNENSFDVLSHFNRWPTWMWGNTEMLWFIDWLKDWNMDQERKVGFHGLDVYSLFESIDQTIAVMKKLNPELAEQFTKKYSCLEYYRENEKEYAKSLFHTPEGCKKEVLDVLKSTIEEKLKMGDKEKDLWLDVEQNARIVKNAENYYRAMVFGHEDSWNIRDQHMMETLNVLLRKYGRNAKAIIWEHNTHIGDYRATDMVIHGQVNIGGLAREFYGNDKVGLVGFGTYKGEVTASHSWDGPTISFDVPEAPITSVEHICHEAIPEIGHHDFFMIFDPKDYENILRREIKGHRAIGVVYNPQNERRGNYVSTSLAARYDAFIFINETTALVPLQTQFDKHKFPETYPYGTHV